MRLLLQSTIDGLMFGSIYAIAALAFGLAYTLSRIFHIAFGAIATCGAFVAIEVGGDKAAGLFAGLAAALAVGTALTLLVRWLVYEPMLRRGADAGQVFVASLGLALVIQAATVLAFGAESRSFPVGDFVRQRDVAGFGVSPLGVTAVLVAATVFAALAWVTRRTMWGVRMRALSSNPEQALLVGIPTRSITTVAWALTGVLSVVALVLFGMSGSVVATSGTQLTLYAVLAVIAGGVGSLGGTYAMGLLIGVLDSVSASKLPGAWSTTTVFVLFIVLLLLRPRGLNPSWDAVS